MGDRRIDPTLLDALLGCYTSRVTNRPPAAHVLRQTIAGTGSHSVAGWARRRRWQMFLNRFPDLQSARVIDLGGTPEFWAGAPVRPAHLTIVNLTSGNHETAPGIEIVEGDACDAANAVGGKTYDIVFSNSTIEHVGGHDRCQAFARSVRVLAPRHWIQTPYRYFPIEPHFVFPLFQFMPVALRYRVAARWPLSYARSLGGTLDDPIGTVLAVDLLSRTHLRYYFPTSSIVCERVVGITKSIIAVVS